MFTKLKLLALCGSMLAACAGADAPELDSTPAHGVAVEVPDSVLVPGVGMLKVKVQHLGLRSGAAVPPLGTGVNPSSGAAGDGGGAGAIKFVPSWSGGAGPVAVYGEQLIVPLSVTLGSTFANASCDVWNPNTGPGVTIAFELWSSNGGLVASNTIPSSTSVVFRSWLQPGTPPVTSDGGQYTLRLTPKNADGSWTTSAAPITVISCAANTPGSAAAQSVTRTWSIIPGAVDVQQGTATCAAGNNTSLSANGAFWIPVPGVAQAETLTALSLYFQGNSLPNVAGISLWVSDPQGNGNVTQVTGVTFPTTTGTGVRGGAWIKAAMSGTPSVALTPSGVSQFFLFLQTNSGGLTSITTGDYSVLRSLP